MDFNDTPEEAKFRADVRAWLEKTVPAKGGAAPRVEVTAEDREGLKAAKAYQAKKAEAGYVGLTWPKTKQAGLFSPAFFHDVDNVAPSNHSRHMIVKSSAMLSKKGPRPGTGDRRAR